MIPASFVKLEIAVGATPDTASPTWVDISDRFALVQWSCGRVDPTQPQNPRQGTFTINNRDNAYNPFTVDLEDVPIRYSIVANGTTYVRFLGYIDDGLAAWTWPEGGDLVITATDRSKFVAGETNLASGDVIGERTSERVARICDRVGIGASDRDIDVTARNMVQTNFNIDALSALDACVATEGLTSTWFVDRTGTFRFDGRHSLRTRPRTGTVQASFSTLTSDVLGASPTFLPLSAPVPGFSRLTRYNRVAVTNALGEIYSAEAASSSPNRHPNVVTQSTVSAEYDAETLLTVYNRALRFMSMISCRPTVDDARAEDLAALDLRDRVRVKVGPPGGAATIDIECTVESIIETAQSGGFWSVDLGLFPTEGFDALNPDDWMIVGDADTGRVGTGTVAP